MKFLHFFFFVWGYFWPPPGYLNPDQIQNISTRYSIIIWIQIKVLLDTTSSSHLLAEKVAELREAALAGQSLHRVYKLVQSHLRRFLFTRIGRMNTSEKIFLKMKTWTFLGLFIAWKALILKKFNYTGRIDDSLGEGEQWSADIQGLPRYFSPVLPSTGKIFQPASLQKSGQWRLIVWPICMKLNTAWIINLLIFTIQNSNYRGELGFL